MLRPVLRAVPLIVMQYNSDLNPLSYDRKISDFALPRIGSTAYCFPKNYRPIGIPKPFIEEMISNAKEIQDSKQCFLTCDSIFEKIKGDSRLRSCDLMQLLEIVCLKGDKEFTVINSVKVTLIDKIVDTLLRKAKNKPSVYLEVLPKIDHPVAKSKILSDYIDLLLNEPDCDEEQVRDLLGQVESEFYRLEVLSSIEKKFPSKA